MKDYYTTETGLHLVKSFAQTEDGRDNDKKEYTRNKHKATSAAAWLLLSNRLEIVAGSDLLGGLAYTSSGEFAALWNCNTSARLRGTNALFKGIAISANGVPVAVFLDHDENGNELGTIYEPIKTTR